MARKRPASILTFGILNLIGGIWDLFVGFFGCIGLFAMRMATTPAPRPGAAPTIDSTNAYITAHAPGYIGFSALDVGLDVLLALLLIASGIGLLMGQSWGRWVSLGYAPLSLLGRLSNFIYRIVFVIPLMNEFYQKGIRAGSTTSSFASGAKVGAIGALVVQLLFTLYPILLVVFMLLPSTTKFFRGGGKRQQDRHEEEQEFDERWDEPRDFHRRDAFRE